MDNKMEILLEKTNIDKDHYQYFYDAKITKIKVNPKTNTWNIFIEKDKLLPIEIYEELENKKMNLDSNASNIEIISFICFLYSSLETYPIHGAKHFFI